jgi:peptidoglycan/LPS O-acetylase OafA/YrhL
MGTPSFHFFYVDVARIISFFGTGVDLFFVISGFCMYLMYISKTSSNGSGEYFTYLKKRWLRIAPVFYFAVLIYALAAAGFNLKNISLTEILKHFLFVKIFFKQTIYGPHFWSLCTEWHFYLILPLLLYVTRKWGFVKAMTAVILCCMIYRVIMWQHNNDADNFINYSIPNRLIEFLSGIVCAWYYKKGLIKWFTASIPGIIAGVIIAFCGRLLMTEYFVNNTTSMGWLARVFNLPVLATGYAMVVLNVLNTKSLLGKLLESCVFTYIGKVSYSMYLWHWIIAETVSVYFKQNYGLNNFWGVNIIFLLCVMLLVPISALSYKIFEAFYFKRRRSKPVSTETALNRSF